MNHRVRHASDRAGGIAKLGRERRVLGGMVLADDHVISDADTLVSRATEYRDVLASACIAIAHRAVVASHVLVNVKEVNPAARIAEQPVPVGVNVNVNGVQVKLANTGPQNAGDPVQSPDVKISMTSSIAPVDGLQETT